jgi:hypothetical protein
MKFSENQTVCPKCASRLLHCPECGKRFLHGQASHCNETQCKSINAPLDCKCGLVASQNLDGVLDYNMNLIAYK